MNSTRPATQNGPSPNLERPSSLQFHTEDEYLSTTFNPVLSHLSSIGSAMLIPSNSLEDLLKMHAICMHHAPRFNRLSTRHPKYGKHHDSDMPKHLHRSHRNGLFSLFVHDCFPTLLCLVLLFIFLLITPGPELD